MIYKYLRTQTQFILHYNLITEYKTMNFGIVLLAMFGIVTSEIIPISDYTAMDLFDHVKRAYSPADQWRKWAKSHRRNKRSLNFFLNELFSPFREADPYME